MKAEIKLFLKRSFPVSFEFAEVFKTQEENEDLAFLPEHIPPRPSGFTRFHRRKMMIIMIRYLKSKITIVMLLPCDFEENPSCFEDTYLIKTIPSKSRNNENAYQLLRKR